MVLCFAADCNHNNELNSCSFFRFPKDGKKFVIWKRVSRRADRNPTSNDRLCSCHFRNNDKENGPSIFRRSEKKSFKYTSPENKKRKLNTEPSIAILQAENAQLKQTIIDLERQVKRNELYFSFKRIQDNPECVLMYTGLPDAATFQHLVNFCQRLEINYFYGWKVETISFEDQMFITLQKLRRDFTFRDMALKYSSSVKTIRNVFFTFLNVLHEGLFCSYMRDVKYIPNLEKIQNHSTTDFSPNCRFLIDYAEIGVETPRSSMAAQQQTYSHHKKKQTFKIVVAVTPSGVICFVSDAFPGSISDKEIFQRSGLMELLHPGDLIIADKGFLIHDILPKGVFLNIPPFLHNPQFTKEEAKYTTVIARARVHVERSIGRIKGFKILDILKHNFRLNASKLFQVCSALVNFQNPLISDSEENFD